MEERLRRMKTQLRRLDEQISRLKEVRQRMGSRQGAQGLRGASLSCRGSVIYGSSRSEFPSLPVVGNCVSGKTPRLLKKALSDRSVIPKQAQNIYKTGFSASEQGSARGMKEFFNKLGRF